MSRALALQKSRRTATSVQRRGVACGIVRWETVGSGGASELWTHSPCLHGLAPPTCRAFRPMQAIFYSDRITPPLSPGKLSAQICTQVQGEGCVSMSVLCRLIPGYYLLLSNSYIAFVGRDRNLERARPWYDVKLLGSSSIALSAQLRAGKATQRQITGNHHCYPRALKHWRAKREPNLPYSVGLLAHNVPTHLGRPR